MNYHQALQTLKLPDPPSASEIKKAFRARALDLHPDRNPDDPQRVLAFHGCVEAYNYLIEHPSEWAASPPSAPGAGRIEDLEDIFDDIFGFTREDRILGFAPPQALALTLVEFAYGVVKRAKLHAFEKCPACGGAAARKNTPVTICTHCFGSGQIRSAKGTVEKVCPKCEGRGRKIQRPCPACSGFGRRRILKWQEVSIPAGLKANAVYTLHSREIRTDRPFDLFIRLSLIPHAVFQVENSDLLCEYAVAETIAAGGGRVDFPGVWGWIQLPVPPRTATGDAVRIPNQGMPLNPTAKPRGDLIIKIYPVPDKKFPKEAQRFLERLGGQHPLYADRLPWWKRLLFK